MPLYVMSPILRVISIIVISKVVISIVIISKAITSIVVVSF
jgi:hypothetical protein